MFCASSLSIARSAKTVELLPAPKMLAMKLMMIQESVSESFCPGKSRRVKGINRRARPRIKPVRSATSMRPLHIAMMPVSPMTNVTALCELSTMALPKAGRLPRQTA